MGWLGSLAYGLAAILEIATAVYAWRTRRRPPPVEQDPLEPDRFGRGALDAAPPERIQPRI